MLKNNKIPVKTIVLNTRDLLNAAPYDLGIRRAPALYVRGRWYQGIKEIYEFINTIKKIEENAAISKSKEDKRRK